MIAEITIAQLQRTISNPRTRIQAIRLEELDERRAKVLGLDMPTKHAATDPSGQREYTGIPDEFKRLALARRKGRGKAAVVQAVPAD